MDSRTRSAFGRLEIVETGRRGRWSEDEKARIVLESLAGPRLVSLTARRHGISRSQLLAWRRTLRPERSEAGPVPGFVPAVIVPEPPTGVTSKTGLGCATSGDDRIEIVLGRGRRVIRVCLSNNAAERALRGFALGRRSWLFAGSERGADRAAAIATLIMTAKLNDVDPQAWLADVLARIADHPSQRLEELLPWRWAVLTRVDQAA